MQVVTVKRRRAFRGDGACGVMAIAIAAALAQFGCGADVQSDTAGSADTANAFDGGGALGDGDGGADGVGAVDGGISDGAGADAETTGGADAATDAGVDATAGDTVADVDAGPVDPWWICPPVKGQGKEHGRACVDNAECMYGHCVKGGFLTGYDDAISYCSKNNACTGGTSFTTAPCEYDDDKSPGGVTYKSAFEKSKSSGNDKRTNSVPVKLCARTCKADGDCASWNPAMPHCIKNSTKYVSLGTQGICGKDPTR